MHLISKTMVFVHVLFVLVRNWVISYLQNIDVNVQQLEITYVL